MSAPVPPMGVVALPLLEVRDLEVGYDGLQVLWGVALRVGEGEAVCLLGPNGAGKSTVVNSISGLLPITQGSVWFMGERVDGLATHERAELGIAHVLERRHVFPYMTVLENLEMGGFGRRASRSAAGQLEKVFELFPRLRERTGQQAGTMSGGEQQMLAIGRGLMSSPSLLILDEPFIGLSPAMVQTIVRAIREVNAMGIGVLFIEQNVSEALSSSSRGYLLETGRIVLEGPSKELLIDPRIADVYLGLSPE